MASNFPTAYVRVASQTYVLQHISNSPPTGEAPEALLRGQVSAAPLAAGLPVLVRHEAA